ncbi:MAG TPA: type II toxin-antitoxin system RelE/ParE family toxin [Desulfobacteraceae bacterium]|nr:type II toxin-antitoxin system RelE/ParE family toxin [Desulfobacteraceae bacterium]
MPRTAGCAKRLHSSRISGVPKTYGVLLTRHAENDLAGIHDYIAADSPANTAAFVRELEKKVFSLASLYRKAVSCAVFAMLPVPLPVIDIRPWLLPPAAIS